MKKKPIVLISLLIVLGVAGAIAYRAYASNRASEATSLNTTTVQRGSLTQTLDSSGTASSGQTATVTWEMAGKVGDVTLKGGDKVEEGQELAALDSGSLSSEMVKARQNLMDAQQALKDLMNTQLQQAEALKAVEEAQQALSTLKQTEVEDSSQALLALVTAQQALKDAQNKRDGMNAPHSTDPLVIEKAQTDYLLAKQARKDALGVYNKYYKKNLTNPDRVRALENLIAAQKREASALALYNWYTGHYTELEIAKADAELEVAKANLETAQANYDNLKNGTSSAQIELADAQLVDAQQKWDEVKNGPSQEDIDIAKANVEVAQAAVDNARLVAPFSGTITEVSLKSGDLVSSGTAGFRIDDLSTMYIELQISEVDLASIKVGQKAALQFDAIADKEFTGEVSEIGIVGSVSQGVVNYPVTIRVENKDGDIRPGMTASVSIIVDQVDDVLMVPNKALRTSSGQRTVTILFEGQQVTIPVTVGLNNGSMTEVSSSQLREGDTVVLNGSTASSSSAANQFRGPEGGMMIIEGGPAGGGAFQP